MRGVAASGYATSPYIGPLSGLDFNSRYSSSSGRSFATGPAMVAARKLSLALRRSGVRLPRGLTLGATPANSKVLAVVRSPTMAQLAEATNVPSNNFFAETLLKLIGAEFGGAGSTRAGAAVVEAFAHEHDSGVHAVDGSGLTRSNRASPPQVVRLLRSVRQDPGIGDAFVQSLAIAGREGTVATRTHGTAASRHCHTRRARSPGSATFPATASTATAKR